MPAGPHTEPPDYVTEGIETPEDLPAAPPAEVDVRDFAPADPVVTGAVLGDEITTLAPYALGSLAGQTISLTLNEVIDTDVFANDMPPLYGFQKEGMATLIGSGFLDSLSNTVNVGFCDMKITYSDPYDGLSVDFASMFMHAGVADPTLSAIVVAESPDSYVIQEPWNYNEAEGKKVKIKLGYDATTYTPHPFEGTLERLDGAINGVVEDLATNVLTRIDLSKTTKKLDMTKELFEKIVGDEPVETTGPVIGAPSVSSVSVPTGTEPPTSPGGSF